MALRNAIVLVCISKHGTKILKTEERKGETDKRVGKLEQFMIFCLFQ